MIRHTGRYSRGLFRTLRFAGSLFAAGCSSGLCGSQGSLFAVRRVLFRTLRFYRFAIRGSPGVIPDPRFAGSNSRFAGVLPDSAVRRFAIRGSRKPSGLCGSQVRYSRFAGCSSDSAVRRFAIRGSPVFFRTPAVRSSLFAVQPTVLPDLRGSQVRYSRFAGCSSGPAVRRFAIRGSPGVLPDSAVRRFAIRVRRVFAGLNVRRFRFAVRRYLPDFGSQVRYSRFAGVLPDSAVRRFAIRGSHVLPDSAVRRFAIRGSQGVLPDSAVRRFAIHRFAGFIPNDRTPNTTQRALSRNGKTIRSLIPLLAC